MAALKKIFDVVSTVGIWCAALASIGAVLFGPALWLDARDEARLQEFKRHMDERVNRVEDDAEKEAERLREIEKTISQMNPG